MPNTSRSVREPHHGWECCSAVELVSASPLLARLIHHNDVGSSSPEDPPGPGSLLRWTWIGRNPQAPAAPTLDQELALWMTGKRWLFLWEKSRVVYCHGTQYAHPDPYVGWLYARLTISLDVLGGRPVIEIDWVGDMTNSFFRAPAPTSFVGRTI